MATFKASTILSKSATDARLQELALAAAKKAAAPAGVSVPITTKAAVAAPTVPTVAPSLDQQAFQMAFGMLPPPTTAAPATPVVAPTPVPVPPAVVPPTPVITPPPPVATPVAVPAPVVAPPVVSTPVVPATPVVATATPAAAPVIAPAPVVAPVSDQEILYSLLNGGFPTATAATPTTETKSTIMASNTHREPPRDPVNPITNPGTTNPPLASIDLNKVKELNTLESIYGNDPTLTEVKPISAGGLGGYADAIELALAAQQAQQAASSGNSSAGGDMSKSNDDLIKERIKKLLSEGSLDSAEEEKALSEQYDAQTEKALVDSRARSGFAGLGLSGATSALEGDIRRKSAREKSLGLADLRKSNRNEELSRLAAGANLNAQQQSLGFENLATAAAIKEYEKELNLDVDNDGKVAGQTPADINQTNLDQNLGSYNSRVKSDALGLGFLDVPYWGTTRGDEKNPYVLSSAQFATAEGALGLEKVSTGPDGPLYKADNGSFYLLNNAAK
jgi:hypothetical protein